jgi:hypothetical protein
MVFTFDAGVEPLTAWSLAELAELVDCALDAGDPIGRFRRLDRRATRPLTGAAFARLLRLLTGEPS